MTTLEKKLKTSAFWLRIGVVNHVISLAVIAFGCAYSGFSCQGDSMKSVLSTYAFTLFTPQVAMEVILLLALFLVSSSLREFRDNWRIVFLFLGTLSLLILFVLWQ